VQALKTVGEIDLLSFVGHRAVGVTALSTNVIGQVLGIGREKPTHFGTLELQHASHLPRPRQMNRALLNVAK